MSKRVLLSGYFGYDNLGDEAILYAMLEGLKSIPGVEVTALSGNPEKTTAKFGVRTVARMNPFAVLRALLRCDLFVSGGGSLLQDVTSRRSLSYYLMLIRAAKLLGKKVMIYGQGIGPLQSAESKAAVGKILSRADLINVRDEQSRALLRETGITQDISVTADTVFLLPKPQKHLGRALLSNLGWTRAEHEDAVSIGLSIRPWKGMEEQIEVIARAIDRIKAEHLNIRIVLLPFHHPGDLAVSQTLYERLTEKSNVFILREPCDEREMLSVMANLDVMISMRLHGLIFAVVAGAYPVGISYDPKIDALMQELQLAKPQAIAELDAELLVAQINEAMRRCAENPNGMTLLANQMNERVQENMEQIRRLLS